MNFEIFGFQIKKKKADEIRSVVTPMGDDGSVVFSSAAAAYYVQTMDIDTSIKNENELIRRYREISMNTECDAAIEEIVNEAIAVDSRGNIALLNLEELEVSTSMKEKIQEEFREIKSLLDFDTRAYELFRSWYIDGRQYHVITIDPDKPKLGIQKIEMVDSRKIRKVRQLEKKLDPATNIEVVVNTDEYFIYNERGIEAASTQGIKLSLDSVVYVPSGLYDQNSNMMLGYLHKAVKPVNQLKMLEDAIVINTVARAPERRIFYIDVGNLPKIKADQYVTDIMNKYRNKVVYDASTGEIRDSKKHMCLDMSTKVPLLDGRILTITELAKEYNDGKTNWAYSCDPITGKFEPGKITWAGVSRPNAKVMRLTLDNGKTITCTPDHTFPVWDKGLVRADQLTVGESMIPHYSRFEPIHKGDRNDYEQIFDNVNKKWEYTHRLVSRWKDKNGIENTFCYNPENCSGDKITTVHHRDINGKNNSPENLVRMNNKDHFKMHGFIGTKGGVICKKFGLGYFNKSHPDYTLWHINAGAKGGKRSAELGYSSKYRKFGRTVLAELMADPQWNENFRTRQRAGWTTEKRKTASEHAKRNNLSSRGNSAQILLWQNREYSINRAKKYKTEYQQSMLDAFESCYTRLLPKKIALSHINGMKNIISEWSIYNKDKVGTQKNFDRIGEEDLDRMSAKFGFANYAEAVDSVHYRNHKIISIEFLDEPMDTGCLTIDGDEIYHNYHTFALEAGIYTKNSMLEDFWMPRREGGKGTEITTLPGSGTLINNDLLTYFEQKLYQSLNVPISRLLPAQGFQLGRSNEITREELKFNKFTSRLRTCFSQLLIDVLRIQLITRGIITADDWSEINKHIYITFAKDNNFVELKDAEIWNNRFSQLQAVDQYVGKYLSPQWVMKNILHLSEEDQKEIETDLKNQPARFSPPKQEEPVQVEDETIEQEDETDSSEELATESHYNLIDEQRKIAEIALIEKLSDYVTR